MAASNKKTAFERKISGKNKKVANNFFKNNVKDILLISFIACSLVLTISIYTNSAGIFGDFLGTLLVGLFGIGAFLLPFVLGFLCIYIFFTKEKNVEKPVFILISSFLVLLITFFHLISSESKGFEAVKIFFINGSVKNGGLVGAIIGNTLVKLLGVVGAFILIISFAIIIFILLTGKSILEFIKQIDFSSSSDEFDEDYTVRKKPIRLRSTSLSTNSHDTSNVKKPSEKVNILGLEEAKKTSDGSFVGHVSSINDDEGSESFFTNRKSSTYIFPPLDLLQKNPNRQSKESKDQLMKNKDKLEQTLASFGVVAKVIQINTGPSVTRYEVSPKQGVKVSKIVNLSDDIALNLAARGIRIEAPIPGKAAVGIEIPNADQQTVYFRDVLENEEFSKFPSNLAFGLGYDITGNVVVTDIAKMPHLLIAGATGSGKSVCINTLIMSILYKAAPDDVKLIMIDPKVVELSIYNGIPHLLLPVVTNPNDASGALNWAVNQMTNRYKQFAEANVRDIAGFNSLKAGYGDLDMLPQIVIIIDELADLMMVAPSEIEDSICRLAQMARAAGIHLIIATQRPSVDIITGVIKANIPSRLAFSVSSGVDSRTILDSVGAEKLLGKGDMLFNPIGALKPVRVQGAFISDKEVENIVGFIKNNHSVAYDTEIVRKIISAKKDDDDIERIIDDVAEFAVNNNKISVPLIKNHFDINTKRASRVMEELEKRGIVEHVEGGRSRRVLMSPFELEKNQRSSKKSK